MPKLAGPQEIVQIISAEHLADKAGKFVICAKFGPRLAAGIPSDRWTLTIHALLLCLGEVKVTGPSSSCWTAV